MKYILLFYIDQIMILLCYCMVLLSLHSSPKAKVTIPVTNSPYLLYLTLPDLLYRNVPSTVSVSLYLSHPVLDTLSLPPTLLLPLSLFSLFLLFHLIPTTTLWVGKKDRLPRNNKIRIRSTTINQYPVRLSLYLWMRSFHPPYFLTCCIAPSSWQKSFHCSKPMDFTLQI